MGGKSTTYISGRMRNRVCSESGSSTDASTVTSVSQGFNASDAAIVTSWLGHAANGIAIPPASMQKP